MSHIGGVHSNLPLATSDKPSGAGIWLKLSQNNSWLWLATSVAALFFYLLLVLIRFPLILNYSAGELDTIITDEQSRGFYAVQKDEQGRLYRWSDAKSYTLFNFNPRKPLKITVWARSAAVAGGPDKPIQVFANGQQIGEMQPDPHNLEFTPYPFTFTPQATDLTQLKLSFTASTFKAPGDPRQLAFQIQAVEVDRTEAWSTISKRGWLLYLLAPLSLLSAGFWFVSRWVSGLAGVLSGVASALSCLVGMGFMLAALVLLSGLGVIDQQVFWLWVVGCLYLAVFFAAAGVALLLWGRAGSASLYQRTRRWADPFIVSHPIITAFAVIFSFNLVLVSVFYLKVYFEIGNISWFARYWDGPEYTFIAHGFYDPNDPLLKIPDFARHSRAYWTAHFPLFPLALKLVAPLVGFSYAPMLVNFFVTIFFGWTLYRLLRDFNYTPHPLWLTLVGLVLPTRWLVNHSVGSSEPMLLLFATLSFYFYKRKWYWGAGLAGMFAAIARPPGIFLFAGFLAILLWEVAYHLWEEKRFSVGLVLRKFNWQALLAFCLIPLGTALVFTVFWWRYGDFLVYFKVPEGVVKTPYPFLVFLYQDQGTPGNFYYFLLETIGIISLWRQKRYDLIWFGLPLTLYVIFLIHPDLMRYSLPAFPFLLLIPLAPYLSGRTARWLALPVVILVLMYSWSVIPGAMAVPETWDALRNIAP
jgi:hypothetical protein